MIKTSWGPLAAAILCFAPPAVGATPQEAQAAAERLLGSDGEDAQRRAYLPFTRRLNAGGLVEGSFEQSARLAGLPAASLPEMLRAFATGLDLERDVKDGDRFWVRWEQEYTIEGHPMGVGRVLWAELRTASAKGTVGIHRFRPKPGDEETFWLSNGQGTGAMPVRLPLENISISSGYGLRPDPFRQQAPAAGLAMGAMRAPALPPGLKAGAWPPGLTASAMRPGLGASNLRPDLKASPLPPGLSSPPPGLKANAAGGLDTKDFGVLLPGLKMTVTPGGAASAALPRSAALVMHQGIDLVAEPGTPVHAAAAGIIVGARANGNYGNWIELEHEGKIGTVYGHLSGFAPGILEGARVEQGQLIGYVGNTGRSTGPHLHFELLANGRATNPIIHSAVRRPSLRGGDLERFRKVVARNLGEVERDRQAR